MNRVKVVVDRLGNRITVSVWVKKLSDDAEADVRP